MAEQDTPGAPLWWVKRLYKELEKQGERFDTYDAYYRGEVGRAAWVPSQYQDEMSRLIELTRSNYMGLVVDAMVERMSVEGFRIGASEQADSELWDVWQFNGMDTGFDQVLLESAIGGTGYVMVAPNPDRPEMPLMFAEHPTQVIVAYAPGSGRRVRAAALKAYVDDWTGDTHATLFLPDAIYKYRTERKLVVAEGRERLPVSPTWLRREVLKEPWPAPNPLGEVPVFEVPNNPRMLTGGVSEIADVIAAQDRILKTLVDRLMTQDYGAFPQKWATGFPDEDAQGNPNRVNVGRDRLLTSDALETRFGQFEAAPLDPYSLAKREDVKDIASRTRTPAQYLLGEMSNVNGETLKASESGLVSKVRQRNRTAGQGAEDAMQLVRKARGQSTDERLETIWRNPEFRTEGELVDSLTKMSTLNVPDEALWEKWGATPLEIERWKAMRAEQDELDPAGAAEREIGRQLPPETV